MDQPPDPHIRRNVAALATDSVAFGASQSFVSASTVLPAFVNSLAGSPVLIGLISTIANSGWLLPQLFAANRFGHQRRKMPYIIRASLIGRPTFWLTGLAILIFGARSPGMVLTVFYAGFALFNVFDGIGAVAWFDVMSKVIPPTKRGPFLGWMQFVSAGIGMGVGFVIQRVLGAGSPLRYPSNYAALFLVSGVLLALSTLSYTWIREPEGAEPPPRMTLSQYVVRLQQVLRKDADFRRLTAVRLALTTANSVSSFYVVYATREVGLGAGAVGGFLSAQIAGGFLASLGLGYLSSRSGNRLTTIIESGLVLAAPILAIVLSLTLAGSPGAFAIAYSLVFVLLGAFQSSHMLGHLSYLLEMAPPAERTTYVGLSNTISGLLLIMPLAAGWLVSATSYRTLFAISAAVAVLAIFFSLRLREPRRGKSGLA